MSESWHKVGMTVGAILLVAATAWGQGAEDKCEAAKNQEAGKYAFCRAKAEAKAIKKSTAPDYAKCDAKLVDKWAKAEQKAIDKGTTCADSVTDTAIQSFVSANTDAVATALDGGALPDCGDGAINVAGELCDGVDLGGESCASLGFSSGALGCDGGCAFDTAGCALGGGGLVPGVDPILPVSGQTAAYGVGSDGTIQAGRALSYTDNGDGTITDNNTGLMWEKKDDSGGLHDKDNLYNWSPVTNNLDGTVVTAFLTPLNSGSFAGYSDWRIPNTKELQSIVSHATHSPSADPVFHQSATCAGCTDVTLPTCSCTAFFSYWTSTTNANDVGYAWDLDFGFGYGITRGKTTLRHVRAVRGGL